jgi:hypothetical protein
MSKKFLWKQVIWLVAINEVKRFFADENITWYVKFDKIFLRTQDQNIKIQAFRQKKALLENINNALSNVWYTTNIDWIYFK